MTAEKLNAGIKLALADMTGRGLLAEYWLATGQPPARMPVAVKPHSLTGIVHPKA